MMMMKTVSTDLKVSDSKRIVAFWIRQKSLGNK